MVNALHAPVRLASTMAVPAALMALSLLMAAPATAQYANDPPQAASKARRDDSYRPADNGPGLGTLSGSASGPSNNPYSNGASAQASPGGNPNDGYAPRYGEPTRPYGSSEVQAQSPPIYNGPANSTPGSSQPADVYRPPQGNSGDDRQPVAANQGGYGQPYGTAPDDRRADDRRDDDRRYDDRRYDDRRADDRGAAPRDYDRDPRNDGRVDGTYTSEEILHAGGSFFGSITQSLARVVENAFQKEGRPNGYILGEEGGGAFIAGLRYGSGTLYTRDQGTRRVHWQGPSVGFDVGGAGSRMMILVYNLHAVDEIYERFGGIDGSAYIVGGIGMTLLTREHITLAPIRSGLGLRLGANIGYLKFTRKGTINPF